MDLTELQSELETVTSCIDDICREMNKEGVKETKFNKLYNERKGYLQEQRVILGNINRIKNKPCQ
jgi:hypothetical protein